ncbi:unnamed protein product [Microthlaspi erraticum]|uniref:RecF/RecN/SMC N-terminal domain-containing protein n=1 Tax=Microthlaspi erraticum TaxID=1685480 RepID=A0A6D2KV74_9BRAS|nr:unnamed protein product [Microthlaspi erraticum]
MMMKLVVSKTPLRIFLSSPTMSKLDPATTRLVGKGEETKEADYDCEDFIYNSNSFSLFSFSAVVGPNGSGKSNLIDAILFVFGKRAKQMRLNKVSELIHNSTNHQNLDSAGVSVQFEEIIDLEDGSYETVPGSDFMITRVAFRDNSSKYYINERSSNFTEVTKILKGKGVDLDNNRFLILQGEVEQISLMKPKAQGPHDEGFLEYLEDIIGTNKYVEKIDELNKQLWSCKAKVEKVEKIQTVSLPLL